MSSYPVYPTESTVASAPISLQTLSSASNLSQAVPPQTPSSLPPSCSTWCYQPLVSSALQGVVQGPSSVLPVQPPPSQVKCDTYLQNFSFNQRMLPTVTQPINNPPNLGPSGMPSLVIADQSSTSVEDSDKKVKKSVKSKKPSKQGTSRPCSGKKRQRNPELWKKNVSKAKKICGDAHVSRNGNYIPAKQLGEIDCSSCAYQCSVVISQSTREELFNMFYSLGSNESQKQFVCQNVTEEATKKLKLMQDEETEDTKTPNLRKVTRKYFLPESDNERHQVCSRFFQATLALGKSFIAHALSHKKFGCYMGQEMRGKANNKTPQDQIDAAKAHISSVLYPEHENFLEVSGKKKKSAKILCIQKGKTVTEMYQMYQEVCEKGYMLPVSLSIYRKIFNEEF